MLDQEAPAVVSEDGTPTEATVDMLQNNGRKSSALRDDKPEFRVVGQKVAAPAAPIAKPNFH